LNKKTEQEIIEILNEQRRMRAEEHFAGNIVKEKFHKAAIFGIKLIVNVLAAQPAGEEDTMETVRKFKEDVDLIIGMHYPPSKTRDQGREMLHERIEYHINHVAQPAGPIPCPECGEPDPVLHCEQCGHKFNKGD